MNPGPGNQFNKHGLHNVRRRQLQQRRGKHRTSWQLRMDAQHEARLAREEKAKRRRQAEERARQKRNSLLGRTISKIRNQFRRKV